MRLGMRFGTGVALAVAMLAGDVGALSFAPASAEARSYRAYDGRYYRPYRGYRGRHHHHRGNGINTGEALLGIAALGGVAAIVASSADKDRRANERDQGYETYQTYPPAAGSGGYDDRGAARYDDRGADAASGAPDGYDDRGPVDDYGASDPVEQCSRAAEIEAQSRGGIARVIGIDRVEDARGGARVNGTLEINSGGGRRGDAPRSDRAGFDCTAANGQIVALNLR